MKTLTVLGSTGSIGTQALEVIEKLEELYHEVLPELSYVHDKMPICLN